MDVQTFRAAMVKVMSGHDKDDLVHLVIQFTDGERHITPAHTVALGQNSIQYVDVHCHVISTPIQVDYLYIDDVVDFATLGQVSATIIDAEFTVLNP